jgi:Uma2 family endonuclease
MTLLADAPVFTATPVARRTPKRWTKQEYRAATAGFLEGQRVYLYRGEVFLMSGMGAMHWQGVKRLGYWLNDTFRPAFEVATQVPFELPDESEPQPDGAVYTPAQEARRPCPNAAVLIVEVCDSSVELDRDMADDYAAAGVPDYWISNVRDRQVEVYRDPRPDAASPTGHRYAERRVYVMGESLAPLAKPDAVVAVATLVDVA